MTGRQRVHLALLLLLAATIIAGVQGRAQEFRHGGPAPAGVVVTTLVLVLNAFGCRDGDTPADGGESGYCLVPHDFVLGFVTSSACVLCFLWFLFYYKLFCAAR